MGRINVKQILPGAEGFVLKIVSGVPTWVAESGGAVAIEDTWTIITALLGTPGALPTTEVDLFNAVGSGKTLKLISVQMLNEPSGDSIGKYTYDLRRTTTVGTGGVVLVPTKALSTQVALPAGVTARTNPTGGAAISDFLSSLQVDHNRPGTLTTTGFALEGQYDLYRHNPASTERPITIPAGEGASVRVVVGTLVGGPTVGRLKIVFSIA